MCHHADTDIIELWGHFNIKLYVYGIIIFVSKRHSRSSPCARKLRSSSKWRVSSCQQRSCSWVISGWIQINLHAVWNLAWYVLTVGQFIELMVSMVQKIIFWCIVMDNILLFIFSFLKWTYKNQWFKKGMSTPKLQRGDHFILAIFYYLTVNVKYAM